MEGAKEKKDWEEEVKNTYLGGGLGFQLGEEELEAAIKALEKHRGALFQTKLPTTLMGSILPQLQILMAMAKEGLLPSFFSDRGLLELLLLAGILYECFTISRDGECWHTIGIHNGGYMPITKYVPPDVEPLLSSLRDSIDAVSLRYKVCKQDSGTCKGSTNSLLNKVAEKFDFLCL
ncbi:hypothetical protein Cgig2_027666 [Carnegiea gigantea]|uniref:Uncharacterized protein n=1 Tax=Carnegiea gigantea TaxID=171969 RepID=A0A9Q1GJM7_9CARY|nr:hypothetical protein Cgig2_027666 [Carnegiea gigantea]